MPLRRALRRSGGADPRVVYIRTSRPRRRSLYPNEEAFLSRLEDAALERERRVRWSPRGDAVRSARGPRSAGEVGIGRRVIDLYSVKPIDAG